MGSARPSTYREYLPATDVLPHWVKRVESTLATIARFADLVRLAAPHRLTGPG